MGASTMNLAPRRARRIRWPWIAALCCLCHGLLALAADPAASLRGQYERLTSQLHHNQFQRPLYLASEEAPSALKGEVYAVADYPFAVVNSTLNDPEQGPANWCDVLILSLNTKYCRASAGSNGRLLSVDIGKKNEQELADTYHVQFNYRAAATSPTYFRVELTAADGPLGTQDYRIVLEAASLSRNRTFLHLTYSYRYGMAGRMAMKAYLATLGSHKIGFSRVADRSAAQPEYIGGVRGVVERNTMRYYLAIDAYLATLSVPPEQRLKQRLATWFNATEQYARQLHEVDRPEYMQMKYREYLRQQAAR